MRQISALMLLGAAIGITAPLDAAGRVEPMQAQNQAPPPEGFRIIGNIYWVGRRVWLLSDHDSAGPHTPRHGHQ